MVKTAFISHSERDAAVANNLVTELEQAGISCWIAPRNIQPGKKYSAAIVEGIRNSELFILIFSRASNDSDAVINEIESAQSMKKTIIPIRIDDIPYSDSLDYYLKSKHHINEFDKSAKNAADNLLTHLGIKIPDNQSNDGNNNKYDHKPATTRKRVITGSIIFIAVLLAVYFIVNNNRGHQPKQTASIEPASGSSKENGTQTPQNSNAYAMKIKGKIYYNNVPITKYSNSQAVIELMDVSSRNNAPIVPRYNAQTGEFTLENVPPGKYTPFVRIESGYPFDRESGGDYFSRLSGLNQDIVVAPEDTEKDVDLKVVAVIHLTKPVDNQVLRTSATDPPEKLYKGNYAPSADYFEWDAVPGTSYYQVRFLLLDKNSHGTIEDKSDRITDNQYRPNLNITEPNAVYSFIVQAYNSKNELIGEFINYYKNGSGGFEFTVAATTSGAGMQVKKYSLAQLYLQSLSCKKFVF